MLHIHALWSYSTQAAARAADKINVPYIIRPAGMLSKFSWQNKGFRKQLYWQLFEKRTVRNASAFHATSPQECSDIKAVRQNACVYTIPNSLEDSAFSASQAHRAEKHVLFLSRLHPVKGIVDRLLPAIANVRTDLRLKIVGDEDEHAPGYGGEIEKAIRKLGLNNRVEMVSGVTGNERWRYFDEASLFVLPSHSENFGIVVAEALARGCPFIITKEVQSAPLLLTSGSGRVVENVPQLSEAIDDLLNDPTERQKMSAQASRFARSNFHGESIASKIVGMYKEILHGSEDRDR